jgi:YHS domain-containing protein
MKSSNHILTGGMALAVALVLLPAASRAADTNSATAAKPKPDLLTTCPVSGDKLGEMGKPKIIIYKGQEVKLCCPDCKKDFDKNPAKYMAKIRAADKADPAPPGKTDKN